VLRASSGASQYVRVQSVPNLAGAMEALKEAGFWIYGADLAGERADSVRFAGRVALVLGSEGGGLRRLVRERCDALVRIPAAGHVDSFNVSVAAGILMYEVRRQQCFPGSP
jgi:23S rRNA (guanosine2251-2'-O)-methyltransferase